MKFNLKNPINKCLFAAITVFCFCMAGSVNAQDSWKTNPKESVVLHDTLGVKMTMITLLPGESLAPHTHDAFQLYIVEGGVIESTPKGAAPIKMTLPTGLHFQSPAMGVHADKNVGTTTIRMMVVEIKPQS